MVRGIALVGAMTVASLSPAQAAEPYQGFNLGGQAINPVCIYKMRPWLSDGDIIVRSIILEHCQNSNWAFHDDRVKIEANDAVSVRIEGRTFAYEVIGKTASGLFALHLTDNYIATFRIDEQTIQPDLLKPQARKVHVLTALADTWVPCFSQARVEGNRLIIEKQVSDLNAPRPDRCKKAMETVEAELLP
jgi:hypothetical protein